MLCFRAEVFQVVIHYHVHICDDLQIVILISHHYPGQKITKKTTKKQSLNTDKTAQCLKIEKKGLIQHCERSEVRLHFKWPKVNF